MLLLKIILFVVIVGLFICCGFYEDEKSNIRFHLCKKQCYALIPTIIFILMLCVTFVPANTVGIRWSAISGTSEKTLDEGIHFKSPIDKIYCIPTTVQERTIKDVMVQTKDAQFVTSTINIKFKVDKKNAYSVYKGYGTLDELKKNIVSNYAQKSIESVVTQYNVIDVLGEKKNEIYKKSSEQLAEMFADEGVSLVQLTIKDTNAGDEIEKAIAAEAVAKKKVETAEQNRLKAEKDAETKIIKAKAEAEANKILTKELTDSVLTDKWIDKWNGQLPSTVAGDNSDFMIGLGK